MQSEEREKVKRGWSLGSWDMVVPFLKNIFLIGGQLRYNVVLISAIHQRESATGTHMSPPS